MSGNDFLRKTADAAFKNEVDSTRPEFYQSGEYLYKCNVTGDFTWFPGYEEIYQGDVKVYECVFHGGMVK